MWHFRVTNIARTRRALFVPAAARDVSLMIAEALEDRTLLSAAADSATLPDFVGDTADNQSAQVWLISANAVGWFLSHAQFDPRGDATAAAAGESVNGAVLLQLPQDSSWLGQGNATSDSGESLQLTPVLVVLPMADGAMQRLAFAASTNVGAEPVSITFHPIENLASSLDASLSHVAPQVPFVLKLVFPQPVNDLLVPIGASTAAVSITLSPTVTTMTNATASPIPLLDSSAEESEIAFTAPMSGQIVSRSFEPQVDERLDDSDSAIAAQEFAGIFTQGIVQSEPVSVVIAVSTPTTVDASEAAVALALWQTSKMVDAAGNGMIVESPREALQMAVLPIIATVETLLTTLDTFAGALLALFGGSGGSSSDIVAPTLQPRRMTSPIMIDSQRPRWALQTGRIEELAAYSLVVAPDQHFDLRDFSPSGRLNAGDSAIRIEFDVLPQHGLIDRGNKAGLFRYSADPGFSGVDTARFRVTFTSGEAIAGNVTFIVPDQGAGDRPAQAIRQVELPLDDWHVSESSPAAIDASFRLSGAWLDLP